MVKTLISGTIKTLRQYGIAIVAVVAFFAFSGTSAQAQSSAKNHANPLASYAAKINVDAYQFNTWNQAHVRDVLEQKTATMKANIIDGSAPLLTRFQYAYYTRILQDLGVDIGAELSVLTSLEKAQTDVGGGISISQMQSTYSYITGQF